MKKNTDEHDLQCACVRWFEYQYPQYSEVFFAVPNGGHRHISVATSLKREGVKAGVADLILLVGNGKYNSLCIEMKTAKGAQQKSQKKFQLKATMYGNAYVVVRSIEQFINVVNEYLKE